MRQRFAISLAACALFLPAAAHADTHLGDVFAVSMNYCPRDSEKADGRELFIHQNQALYSLLEPHSSARARTFKLPDLNGGALTFAGHGPKLLWCIWTHGSYPPRPE